MLYIRVSLMTPKVDEAPAVARIMDELLAFYATQPGFLSGYKLRSADANHQIGRITVWRSGEDADATAQHQHVLAQRSELAPLIESDSHTEWSFEAAEASESLAAIVG
jgi:quinol monooxygenase YgiN